MFLAVVHKSSRGMYASCNTISLLGSESFLAPDCVQHIPTWQPIPLPAEAGFPVKRGHLRGVYADPTGTLKNMVIHCISALMGHDVKGGNSWRCKVGPLRCWKLDVS